MSSDSRSERERLKEEYKSHYRKMRETRERYSRAKKTRNITEALTNMDKSQMLESFDDILHSVKHKLAAVEARLDVAMEDLEIEDEQAATEQELDEEMRSEKAKDTLRQVKMEMGLLYNEIERQADSLEVNKTIGSGAREGNAEDASETGSESTKEER